MQNHALKKFTQKQKELFSMTHEQKIEAISNKIREALPYLNELSHGCVIEKNNDKQKYIVNSIFVDIGRSISLYTSYLHNENRGSSFSFFFDAKRYKIIGHEPKLNDVLAWLGLDEQSKACLINFWGEFFDYNDNTVALFVSWNLEKPYLKDQSAELIDFLYSLIEK